MVLMSSNVLNHVHRFSLSNTAIFSSCGFHFCFFHEQDVIFRHCILPLLLAWPLRITLWLST